MTNETVREKLNTLLERLRLEQTIEDMQAEIDGRTQTTSRASVDKAMARVQASIDRFDRGEPVSLESNDVPAAQVARAPWDALRASLAWLSISLDGLAGSAATAPAGYRRGPGPGAADRPEAPATLLWVPTGSAVLSTGQVNITLAHTGAGTPSAPAIDLRHDGEPIEPAKTTFNAEAGTLTIRLPKLDVRAKVIELAQGEDGAVLVVNIRG